MWTELSWVSDQTWALSEEENKLRDLQGIQAKSLHDVIRELVRQVTSPNTCVREQAIASLQVLAEIQGKPVTEVMSPHKEVSSFVTLTIWYQEGV